MKKNRILCLLLALFLLLACVCLPVWAEPETEDPEQTEEPTGEPENGEDREGSGTRYADYTALLTADDYEAHCTAALLIERNTDTVIYQLNPSETVYPASLTKIMTCLLAIEKCRELGKSLDDPVTVSSTAFAGLDDGGSSAGLQPGDVVTLRELLYCMMLESANESCNVVAEYLAGSAESYVEWMNARAAELGCTHTHFANTHGLHDPNHFTTAFDLAVITEAAIDNETFWEIATEDTYTVKSEQYSGVRDLGSTNYLIRESHPEYYYSKAQGVKTGYTSAAGRCLISTASDGNLRLLAIVLGTQDNAYAADGLQYRSFVEAKNLFEYGFDNFEYSMLLSTLDMEFQIPVTGGEESRPMVLYPASDVVCLLPQGYDPSKIEKSWTLYSGGSTLQAPLEQDQEVGVVTVTYDGVVIGSTQLKTLRSAKAQTDAKKAVNDTLNFFQKYWWVFLALVGLIVFLLLVLIGRYYITRAIYRAKRRKQREQRRAQAERRRAQADPWERR